MKILIGMDESPHSRAAVDFVKRMKWAEGTRVLVLSAVRPLVSAYLEAYVPAPDVAVQVEDEQMRFYQEVCSRAERDLRSAGLATEVRAIRGDPREALIEEAAREGVDLIVLGSHGRSGLGKLLLGSVASHVVTHAPCSVLVVKAARASGSGDAKGRTQGKAAKEEPHSWG